MSKQVSDISKEKKTRTAAPERRYSFMQNRECEYFPCHPVEDTENFNCLFCYCPLYALGENCGGNFTFKENGHKDCSACAFPHMRENFDQVTARYKEIAKLIDKNRVEE